MIRKYEHRDLQQVLDVWYEASVIAHHFLDAAFFEKERKQIETVYLPLAETWVFESDHKVVGFLSLIDNEVGGLFIHPDHQGKGMGRNLLNHATTIRTPLELNVFEENTSAVCFYETFGFIRIGEEWDENTSHKQIRMRYVK